MSNRDPIAFLSYVRSDDAHDGQRITTLRERLEGEVRMQTGSPFAIFQDRNDITWGQQWKERIDKSISDAVFLIPIITPSFFNSPMCRDEFDTFRLRENVLGLNRLILPIYYVSCKRLENRKEGVDEIADLIATRNWADWRELRFKSFDSEESSTAIANIARQIVSALEEVYEVQAKEKEKPVQHTSSDVRSEEAHFSKISASKITIDVPESRKLIDDKKLEELDRLEYYAFTTKFDEVVRAVELVDPVESTRLSKLLSKKSSTIAKSIRKENILKFRDAPISASVALTILLDNSGSMRGRPILNTAAWSLILAQWLERIQVSTEILGFTTRAWKGGQSREAWLAANRPENPGRLNDLRHIIYKDRNESAIGGVPGLGVMLREGLLKENIDGEAILWACERLRAVNAKHKALIVVSDGAPVDDSTLSVNRGDFLQQHLYGVIDWLNSTDIFLGAVGIEHDVSMYYRNSLVAESAELLGVPIVKIIDQFLSQIEK